jgi:hypothetical protein
MALASVTKRGVPLYIYNTLSYSITSPITLASSTPTTVGGNVYVMWRATPPGGDVYTLVSVEPGNGIITTISPGGAYGLPGFSSQVKDFGFFKYNNNKTGANGILYDFLVVDDFCNSQIAVIQSYRDFKGTLVTTQYPLQIIGAPGTYLVPGLSIGCPVVPIGGPPIILSDKNVTTWTIDNTTGVATAAQWMACNVLSNITFDEGISTIACSPTTNVFYTFGGTKIYRVGTTTSNGSNVINGSVVSVPTTLLQSLFPIGYSNAGAVQCSNADIAFDPYGNLWFTTNVVTSSPSYFITPFVSKFVFSDSNYINGTVTYSQQISNQPSKGLVILDGVGNGYYSSTVANGVFMINPYYTY